MWSDSGSRDSEPQVEIDDIQGDILVGLQKDFEWFIFFEILNVNNFKDFARRSLVPKISSTADVLGSELALKAHRAAAQTGKLPLVGVNIAFTEQGLEKLEVPEKIGDIAFNEGMAQRSALLNDPQGDREFNPGSWKVGGTDHDKLHGVLLITGPNEDIVGRARIELTDSEAYKAIYVELGNTRPNNRGSEHFGFLDGISQPGIRGKMDRSFPDRQFLEPGQNPNNRAQGQQGSDLVWPGQFVFGYVSATDKVSEPPDGPGERATGGVPWARNGSLMVIRRLIQRVPEFNRFLEQEAGRTNMDSELFGARMVGRWKSGAPLSIAPEQDRSSLGADASRNNDFDFDHDRQGRRCPFAAHIRKVYSRSADADAFSRRLIRRGIPFGPELTPEEKNTGKTVEERGLMFVCYQTSIVRQFESITKKMNDPGQHAEGFDALVGQYSDLKLRDVKGLAIGYPVGEQGPKSTLPDFVRPSGGGYFFMPSISTFKVMVAQTPSGSGRPVYRKPGTSLLLFSQSDVEEAFCHLVDLFNAANCDELLRLMTKDVTWKKFGYARSIVGAVPLVQWLKDQPASSQPRFLPDLPLPKPAVLRDDGSMLISGSGKWQDDRGAARIGYNFYFTREEEGGPWFLAIVRTSLR